jgi:ketosteroid isomerase-like protein
MKQIALVFTLVLVPTSCTEKKVDQEGEAEKLMELSRQWAKDAHTDDHEAVLNYWASDALVMGPGIPIFKGYEDIINMLEDTSEMPGFGINWEPREAYVSESGDLGYVIATNYLKSVDSLVNTTTSL